LAIERRAGQPSAGRKKRSLNLIINQSRRHVDERERKVKKGLLINIW